MAKLNWPDWIIAVVLNRQVLGLQDPNLRLSRVRIDDKLEIINLMSLKASLEKNYGQAYMQTFLQSLGLEEELEEVLEQEAVTKHKRFVEVLAENSDSGEAAADREARQEEINTEKADERFEKQQELIESLKPKDPSPSQTTTVTWKELPDYQAFAKNFQQDLAVEQVAEIYEIFRRLYVDEAPHTSDSQLREFTFESYSDGSYNIIAANALYDGMRIMPDESFQTMKEQGELMKSMVVVVFARDDVALQQIKNMVTSERSPALTPFKTTPQ